MFKLIAFKRQRFTLEDTAAKLHHAHLGEVEPCIRAEELLAAAPFVIHSGKLSDALKGGELVGRSTGFGSEFIK